MNENILLSSDFSRKLYASYAENLPIIDYHNHLSVADIKSNRKFSDITELWISPDPYKARVMRICGVDENYITGDADNYSKFLKWCETLPQLIGNPIYTWSELELKRIFGIDEPLSLSNVESIWNTTSDMLRSDEFSNNAILERFNIKYNSPCSSLTDDISFFTNESNIAPSLRGDNIVAPSKEFVAELSIISGTEIKNFSDFMKAISNRLDKFYNVGCRFCDHALDNGFKYIPDDYQNELRFQNILNGKTLGASESAKLSSFILLKLANEYCKRGMTMLLHIGAQRKTSDRLASVAGPFGGYAAIGSCCDISSVINLLNDVEKNGLPRVILFTLNPADSASMSVLSGSFSESGVRAKIQQGPAWWWCDHSFGIRNVLECVNAYGVLSTFVGMTTDSRSILSFVRHEYFRRILCSWIAEKAESGEIPKDQALLEETVQKICYGNAYELIK